MREVRTRFSLLFFLKKQRNLRGNQLIYLRITLNGKRTEFSTQRECDAGRWNVAAGRAKGTKEDVRALNAYLDLLQSKAYDAQHEFLRMGLPVTGEGIKNSILGIEEKPVMLISVFEQHNKIIEFLIGKGYARATWVKYETTLNHIRNFLKWKYQVSDMNIRNLKYSFVTDFEFYLQSEKNIDINTNGKYIKNLKKVITECVVKGWLDKNPFLAYKVKHIDPDIPHLTEHELATLEAKEFTNERLSLVKDLFVFSCYTGLAYVDASKLTKDNIHIGIDKNKWIMKNREKTDVASRVPLLPPALAIIEKYKDHPKNCNAGTLLPVLSNQKINAYLKEIADVCGINKEITFHVARHTFATTVTLGNGVPIETVSKMLGHKKLQTTQIYAKVLDNKISDDMQALKNKLHAKSSIFKKSSVTNLS